MHHTAFLCVTISSHLNVLRLSIPLKIRYVYTKYEAFFHSSPGFSVLLARLSLRMCNMFCSHTYHVRGKRLRLPMSMLGNACDTQSLDATCIGKINTDFKAPLIHQPLPVRTTRFVFAKPAWMGAQCKNSVNHFVLRCPRRQASRRRKFRPLRERQGLDVESIIRTWTEKMLVILEREVPLRLGPTAQMN